MKPKVTKNWPEYARRSVEDVTIEFEPLTARRIRVTHPDGDWSLCAPGDGGSANVLMGPSLTDAQIAEVEALLAQE